jgi:geranylgeranyl pyrophosphate synthase
MDVSENIKNVTLFVEKLIDERRDKIEKAVEKYFPRDINLDHMIFTCGKPTYEYDIESAQEGIHKPGRDLIDRGGKRWRPVLMMLIIDALGNNSDDFLDFIVIPEIIHNGTLIIDDIEDNSYLRRGRPTIHQIYGTDIAINAGNAMYYIPLLSLIKQRKKFSAELLANIYEIYAQEMINIAYGQGADVYWHKGKMRDISVEKYLQMAAYKTGTLARMSAKIGAKLAGANNNLVKLVGDFSESIAVAFQIQDDILNLQEMVGKEFGEDIKEGKQSLMVIRALQQLPIKESKRLIVLLDKHTDDPVLIKEAIDIIKSTDAFEFSKNIASNLVKDSWKNLEDNLSESEAKNNLRMLANFLIQRSH